jgi:putative iron-dependent peroxidase
MIGRAKLSDIEQAEEAKKPYAHNVLTNINDENGVQLQILRDNMPFGDVGRGESGTYFIGYSCEPGRIERMLDNMFIGDPPGVYDRLLDFSTAVTGGLFFVPTVDFLDQVGSAPAGPADASPAAPQKAQASPPTAQPDGSLGIGSLKQ